MSLTNLLPTPTKEDEAREQKLCQRAVSALVKAFVTAPPYGQRRGWVPCNPEDFGDGGVSPEIHVAQYPLGMGMKGKESTSNALAVQLDAQGKVKYDLVARQGHGKDKNVYSKASDPLPSEITNEEDPALQRPLDDEIDELIDRTKKALEKIRDRRLRQPCLRDVRRNKLRFNTYAIHRRSKVNRSIQTQSGGFLIRMVEAQVDPLGPPKFKINKKIPRGPPSPAVPVMRSSMRKVTVKEQKERKIPPCISTWDTQRFIQTH